MQLGLIGAVGAVVALLSVAGSAAADKNYGPGVTDTEIKIGQTEPYSGPASAYGAVGLAQAAYFKMLNEQGGINGRKINLLSVDNSYSPPKAFEATRRLVEQDQVLAIMGTLGTPPNVAVHKYLHEAHVPNLAIISGAGAFKDPAHFPWTMSVFASYRSEGKIYGKYILATKPEAKIAVLYQNDDFGRDYLAGLKEGLGGQAEKMVVAVASYEVADPTVDSQIVSLRASGADVLMEFGGPKAVAQAIRKSYDIGWRPQQFVSNPGASVGTTLKPAGLEKSIGITTAASRRDPSDPRWADDPDMKTYREFMRKYYPEGDPESPEAILGYDIGYFTADILRRCGDNLTREHLIDIATHTQGAHYPAMFPGATYTVSPTDYDGFKQFQLLRFDGERYVPVGDLITG
jgi:branched-chain amino acid transport system substrate-binding protein